MSDAVIGKVKFWMESQEFGFIEQENGPDCYVHISLLADGFHTLTAGQKVEFTVGQGQKGPCALNVKPL